MDPTSDLKEKFKMLQEQQKERYRSRLNSKTGRGNNESLEGVSDTALTTTFPLGEDDLGLLTSTQEMEATSSHSTSGITATEVEESSHARETTFLHKEVERLQLNNAELKASLKQRERELTEIQKAREEERMAISGATSTATQRIVELSRRNRELSAELTAEKNRVRQLRKKLKESDEQNQTPKESKDTSQPTEGTSAAAEVQSAITALQEQLLHSKQKTTEYRNQCQLLKQDLKVAHRVLAKEVGEGVSVSVLMSGVSGWRGRAQQIIALQNRVSELKQQLERVQQENGKTGRQTSTEGTSRVDARQKATIQKLESERKKTLGESRLELESLQSECAKVQQQCGALKARNKTLTADVKSLKSRLATLLEKNTHDDELIQALMKSKTATVASTEDAQQSNWKEEKEHLQQANQNLQCQLSQCLSEIESLKQTDRPAQDKQQSHEGHRSQKQLHIEALKPKADVMDNPSRRTENSISLPPLIHPRLPPTHTRKPDQRLLTQNLIARKSMSAGQTPTQQFDSDLQTPPQGCDLTEARALAQVAQVERDRLMELVSTLQQRLDASTDRFMRLETELRNQRQCGAKLEKQLGRLRAISSQSGSKHKQQIGESSGEKLGISELENRLAVQLDENAVLRETLELTRHEKMDDIKLLHSMLQEAKQLFMDSVKRLRSCSSKSIAP